MAEPTPPPPAKPPAKPAEAKPAAAKPAPAKPGAAKPGAAKAPAKPAEPAPMAAPTMKAEIRARMRKGRPSRFEVPPAGGVLGRDEAAAVPIPLDGVSREHARIQWDGRGWWIDDLKSTNGTFVNGEKVAHEKLQHLDVIGLGRNADIVFLLRALTEAAPAARTGVVRAALTDPDGAVYEIAVGEFTLGRSVACNVVAVENAVSKVHARIDRSSDQVLLEDLSSSNGTFVNGTRVRTAVLRDGDTLELARVAKFTVTVEQGELSGSGVFRTPVPGASGDQPKFSGDWKTRYEWDPAELAAIAAAAAGQRPPELDKKGQPEPPAGPKHVVQGAAQKPVEGGKATSPAVLPARPAAAPVAKPAVPAAVPAPAAAKPAAPVVAPAAAKPAPAPPAASPAAAPVEKPVAAPAEKAVPRPVKSEPPTPPVGSPPPRRPATPVGSDPASTPSAPKLQPARIPPPPVRPAAAAPPPPEEEFSATLAEMPTPAMPMPAAPAPPIAAARFKGDKFAFAVTETGRFDVGRSATVPLRVDHTTVSRRHAALTLTEDRRRLILEDLGAANGTRVNGVEIKGTQDLRDGDALELGEVRLTVTFER
jgi:pSer/pThr/pTyr-binding forkhead associated (FHA) protein